MEWISVKDRLPQDSKEYHKFIICYTWIDTIFEKGAVKQCIDIAGFNEHYKFFVTYPEGTPIDDADTTVTHWMPLPEPPTV